MRNHLIFLRALVLTNLRASLALRGAFLLQLLFMIANNLIFFVIWWIFFHNFREVRGWRLPDVTALFGLVSVAYGLTMVFGGGVRNLARFISQGELDGFLTQPKNLLLHVLGSSSAAFGWGDFLSGVGLLFISGMVTPAHLPLFLIFTACGLVLFLSTGVLAHSSAFWLGDTDGLARQFMEFVITFSIYPQSIFTGFIKLLLFTLIPAGFIGYLPVELLRHFDWGRLGLVLGATIFYAALASAVFHVGLRRYESGSRFGVRA